MRYPWANVATGVLVLLQLVTGLVGLLGTSDPFRILFWLHAVGAYALVVVLFAKALIVVDVLRRRPGWTAERVQLAALVALLLTTLATGLLWITAGSYSLVGMSVINLHAFLALALLLLLVQHVIDRRWIVRVRAARDRRAFLRLVGAAAVGVVAWRLEGPLQRLAGTPGARRRFTGSYERGSFSGDFPEVIWLNDSPPLLDGRTWSLSVEGAVARPLTLRLHDLDARRRSPQLATIDCTGGWFAHQRWEGVPLAELLASAGVADGAHSVVVESATGYARRFSLDHARTLLLATHVAGAPLSQGHGYPLRLVVPDRRGFEWVKWVVRIRVVRTSELLQPPLPVT